MTLMTATTCNEINVVTYVALIVIFLKMILTTLSVSVTAIPIAQCSMLNAHVQPSTT